MDLRGPLDKVTEMQNMLEQLKKSFSKDRLKLHELDVFPEGGPAGSSTQKICRHHNPRRGTDF